MPKVFGFNDEELKLLLVAVRHMRRTFLQAQAANPDQALSGFAERYDALFAKLLNMTGPLPPEVSAPIA
jgi:hypothetical protein